MAAADGLQLTAQETTTAHHFANVLFNIMRGGIFVDNYQVERDDLCDFVRVRNRAVWTNHADWFADLPPQLSVQDLYARAGDSGAPDLIRLCYEYLPLTFSRRHGDPSRPWNRFSINVTKPDGSARLDYQGNWRDIFQNWEPLALSFPGFVEGMVVKFLNATTVDGYNPYRITRDGIEWETPEPHNPWSNIGYWSDHQIIYLLKLLEDHGAGPSRNAVQPCGTAPVFSYANVPYRLRPYPQMLADWNNTIEFDHEQEEAIAAAVASLGTDGRLLRDADGAVVHVTLTEKLLVLLLAKLTNLAPEGGIWMNTQRPEWNDANNALVGKGLSVVTVGLPAPLHRLLAGAVSGGEGGDGGVNPAVVDLLGAVHGILLAHQPHLASGFSDQARRAIMDQLGMAATAYRTSVYRDGVSANAQRGRLPDAARLPGVGAALCRAHAARQPAAGRPDPQLQHPAPARAGRRGRKPLSDVGGPGGAVVVGHVGAGGGAGGACTACARVISIARTSIRTCSIPIASCPVFCRRTRCRRQQVAASPLVAALAAANDRRLLICDDAGVYHFNGSFRNAGDVARTLDELAQEPAFAPLVQRLNAPSCSICSRPPSTIERLPVAPARSSPTRGWAASTGTWCRSCCWLRRSVTSRRWRRTRRRPSRPHWRRPTTTSGKGWASTSRPPNTARFPPIPTRTRPWAAAPRQPGMTGQVKEEILTRFGELGVSVRARCAVLCAIAAAAR